MLPDIKRSGGIGKTVQTAFGGLDRRPDARDGTFQWMEGMTCRQYPLMASRERRYIFFQQEAPFTAAVLGFGDVLLRIMDGYVYYNDWFLCFAKYQIEDRMIPFGGCVVLPRSRMLLHLERPLLGHVSSASELPISPQEGDAWVVGSDHDRVIYVYQQRAWTEVGPLTEELETEVTLDSPVIGNDTYQGVAAEMNMLQDQFHEAGFDTLFSPGDAVQISGCTRQPENNQTLIIREVTADKLRFYENSFRPVDLGRYTVPIEGLPKQQGGSDIVYAVAGSCPRGGLATGFSLTTDLTEGQYLTVEQEASMVYLHAYDTDGTELWRQNIDYATAPIGTEELLFESIPCTAPEGYMEYGAISIKKLWPEGLVNVFESANRLWGWVGKTICCSKLGDPSNWFFFDGVSEDSWSIELQTPDALTGGCLLHGYPTFFSERKRYMVYGNTPSSYQLAELDCEGVRQGCGGSVAIVNDTLYYVSREGVMADTGAVPQSVGQALGPLRLSDAYGGRCGNEYWVSGRDDEGALHTLVYDTVNGIWVRDGDQHFRCFTEANGKGYGVYEFEEDDDTYLAITCLRGVPDWESHIREVQRMTDCITNDYTVEQPNRKRVHRVQVRVRVNGTARNRLGVFIMYDSDGVWHQVASLTGNGEKKSLYIPVLPRRCDHFRLRFSGYASWILESLALETRQGSPMF